MNVHFTSTPRTGDPCTTLCEKWLYIYRTTDSKPYPDQLSDSDNDVQGHTSIAKDFHQRTCFPEAGGASKPRDHMQGYLRPRQEAVKGKQERPRVTTEKRRLVRLETQCMRISHNGKCV